MRAKRSGLLDMEVEEASRLFIIEARRRSPKWGENLNQDEMNSLKEISSIMHGHPLAIKLTAALVASRSLASIRDELRRNPPQEVLDRFDVSYADLTESQKRAAWLSGCLLQLRDGRCDQKRVWKRRSIELGEGSRRTGEEVLPGSG